MTHPETPEVGGEAVPASTDPFLDIAEEMLGQEPEEEASEPEPETDEEELDLEEEEEEEPDLPAIEPPVSLTAEEKEAFKGWPRDAQEAMVRRVGELEKGFQTKAQEAAQKERQAMQQAAEYIRDTSGEQAEILEYYANLLVVPRPPARLAAENPALYAQQLEAHEQSLAQRQEAQQRVQDYRAQQQQYQQIILQHEQNEFRQQLGEMLPEFFDETNGPKIRDELTATARFLGFSVEEISTATQIMALKKVSDLKAKADKYDQYQKRKMERVRAGKTPPPVTKPGAPRGAGQVRSQRAEEAFARAKASGGNARVEAFDEYLRNSGVI